MSLQIHCFCGLPAIELQCKESNKDPNNVGRYFLTCNKTRDDPTKCRFFQWKDELTNDDNVAIMLTVLEKRIEKLEKTVATLTAPAKNTPAVPKKRGKPAAPKVEVKKEKKAQKSTITPQAIEISDDE